MVPKSSESHGGDDVAVYASGPWSHLFSGNYEQNYIPIAEAYAARIGPFSFETYFPSRAPFVEANFCTVVIITLTIIRVFVKYS